MREARRLALGVAAAALGLLTTPAAAEGAAFGQDPGGTAESGAESRAPQTFSIPRLEASAEIEIDGRLQEPAWQRAQVIRVPWEIEPAENAPAPVETEALVTYDDANLYVGFRAHDPRPSAIRAHLSDRDEIGDDDLAGFILDTFNDHRRAVQFIVNPYGVQGDAVRSGGEEDDSWDAIWSSAGRITTDGFVAEIAVPFRSLSFQAADGPQTWGFMVLRVYPRSVRRTLASFSQDYGNSCFLCQADHVVGFAGVRPGLSLELNPTLTMSRTDERPDIESGSLETGSVQVEPGVNVRWRATPNLTFDGTVNPDFSQVEADAAQLEVNQRFALQFEEKRPFFLEGSELFPEDLVFTRTVVDPIAGLKLTGKVGPNAIAGFITQDEVTALIFPGAQESSSTLLDRNVTGGVLRYRRDIGTASSLGLIATDREGRDYHNRVIGTDGLVRVSESNSVSFMLAHSETTYPDSIAATFGQPEEAFGGNAAEVDFDHTSREWEVSAGYSVLGPEFRADFGFQPQVGVHGPEARISRDFWGESAGWFSRIGVSASGDLEYTSDGELNSREIELGGSYEGPLQSFVELEYTWERQRFAGRLFDLQGADLFARMQPSGDVSLLLSTALGDGIDFANVRKATVFHLGGIISVRLWEHLDVALDETYERFSLGGVGGREIFRVHISDLRTVYYFNRNLFIRAILQYRTLNQNPLVFEEPVEAEINRLFTQFLFSYKLNPRTVLFAGFSNNSRALTETDLAETSRSFFLKLGYAWRP